MECEKAEKLKYKEDQKSGFPKLQSHNIQDAYWRIYTNVPTSPDGKINSTLGDKVSNKFKESIEKSTFMTPMLSLWHKIDILHETSHTIVDWEALIMATKKSPSIQL